MKVKDLKITKIEVKRIIEHLELMKDNIPKSHKGYININVIRYGFMGRKQISIAKIKYIAKELGYDWW